VNHTAVLLMEVIVYSRRRGGLTSDIYSASQHSTQSCSSYWGMGTDIGVRARGLGGLQPPPRTRAKPLFFGQKLNFSGRSQQPKMEKIYFVLYLLNKKNGIHSI